MTDSIIDSIKSNGKVNINELSKKQVIALMNLWDTNFAKKENTYFTWMLKRCYKSTPWNENAPMLYIHSDENTVTTIPHAFFDMDEGDEEMVMRILNNKHE